MTRHPRVALVHDYLTQRGGAERVVLSMTHVFPEAPLFTSLYDPGGTFPGFQSTAVRTTGLDRLGLLRRHHRLALPVLAPAFSRLRVEADVLICSSSGWAHAARSTGAKVVYCYTPARWLYQAEHYAGGPRRLVASGALCVLGPSLRSWDRRAAAGAARYLAISTVVQTRVRQLYGIDAEILAPPVTIDARGPQAPVARAGEGFALCVSRLLAYKNVQAVVDAFAGMPDLRLVVVGTGPQAAALERSAPANVRLLGGVGDDQLRWLYAHCQLVVAAGYEDFGLTPLEGASFAKPAVALRWGGFLDTILEGETGLFFDSPDPRAIADAVTRAYAGEWSEAAMLAHSARFAEDRFATRLREIVHETAAPDN